MLKTDQLTSAGLACAADAPSDLDTKWVSAQIPSWKRALDVACVLLALPVLIPVGILLGVYIKIVSPGPAFFRQQRVGHFGKRFMCLKFRTMKVNSDETVHQNHLKELMKANRPTRKLDCAVDARLIPGGLVLRAMGVDELPQLINVLRGEMSLVGPRPCTPFEFDLLSPRHKRRCGAPPGLTGLWQISGKNKTTFEEMINLDLRYVEEKSLWFDLKIIALTPFAILVLIWEMKILRNGEARRREAFEGLGHGSVYAEKSADKDPGTLTARE
jgi:exopolysaccharide production protein ExoY